LFILIAAANQFSKRLISIGLVARISFPTRVDQVNTT